MGYKIWIILFMICKVLVLCCKIGYAEGIPSVEYGTYITNADESWEETLGPDFPAEKAVVLSLDERLLVLYGKGKPQWKTYLVVLDQGQKQILWEFDDDIFFLDWLGVEPTLTGGFLNENTIPDFIITYTLGSGPGSGGQSGESTMVFILDGQEVINGAFGISAYSITRCRPNEEDCEGGEYLERGDVLLFLEPKNDNLTLYIRFSIKDRSKKTYKLTEYRISENSAIEIRTVEGGNLHISELLRSIILTRRQRGEIPLFFNENGMLLNERDWFTF
jgi:hypothetical protein